MMSRYALWSLSTGPSHDVLRVDRHGWTVIGVFGDVTIELRGYFREGLHKHLLRYCGRLVFAGLASRMRCGALRARRFAGLLIFHGHGLDGRIDNTAFFANDTASTAASVALAFFLVLFVFFAIEHFFRGLCLAVGV
jgi:hypothetical protein